MGIQDRGGIGRQLGTAASRALAGAVGVVLACGSVFAQQPPRLLVSSSAKEPTLATQPAAGRIERPSLRPNAQQEFHVYAENPSGNEVTVVAELVDSKGVVAGAQTAPIKLRAGERQKIVFTAPTAEKPATAPAPPPAGTPPPAPPEPGVLVAGPPFEMQIRLMRQGRGGQSELADRIPIAGILRPQDYTRAEADYNTTNNTLTVTVRREKEFLGKAAPVQLVLPPDRLPGLKRPALITDAQLRASLGGSEKDPKTVTLYARNFFVPPTPRSGFFYVSVDGYERAFVFETQFTGGRFEPSERLAMRLYAAPYSLPKPEYPVRIEVDNWTQIAAPSIQLAMYKPAAEETEPLVQDNLPPGAMEEQVRVDPAGKDGAVVFTTHVRDWMRKLNTEGFLGKRGLEATLSLQGTKQPVLNSRGESVGTVRIINDEHSPHVYDSVVFDASGPQDPVLTAISDVPTVGRDVAVRGRPLKLRARAVDEDSGIADVRFYYGQATDDKLAQGARPIDKRPTLYSDGFWEITIQVDKQATSPLDVAVKFVNGVGLEIAKSRQFEVVESPSATSAVDAAKTGEVTGTVSWGGRILEPDLDVLLADTKGMVRKTKSGKDGAFVFKDVPPGVYTVSSSMEESGGISRDEATVTVEAGKKTPPVKLELSRSRP